MTNTPIQIAEHAPSRPIQRELSREANLSPKFEALGARQGRREMLDFDCLPQSRGCKRRRAPPLRGGRQMVRIARRGAFTIALAR